eukprot:2278599-Amphidinium_carterae.1
MVRSHRVPSDGRPIQGPRSRRRQAAELIDHQGLSDHHRQCSSQGGGAGIKVMSGNIVESQM